MASYILSDIEYVKAMHWDSANCDRRQSRKRIRHGIISYDISFSADLPYLLRPK